MKSKNPIKPTSRGTSTLPPFRILLVEDEPGWIEVVSDYFRDYASSYYDLHILVEGSVDDGMTQLKSALTDGNPLDVVLLDYLLPPRLGLNATKDLSLPRFCTQHRGVCHWVAQLCSIASDPELIKLWSDFNLAEISIRLLQKNSDNLTKLAQTIFFREITIPLRSTWLAAELGMVESVMGRREHPPRGFDIYRFVHRMGEIWPRLDAETRTRAHELFSIEPGDSESDRPKRIGFKSFTHD